VRPSFIVDITPFIEQRYQSLMAYRSQYANQARRACCSFPKRRFANASLPKPPLWPAAGVRYGEPFVQKEVGLVDDLTLLPVQSI